ncbi:protein boule-like [Exaiptasia diaphana]|uniref:RRM domain-containing protein n=1 Tax=Exaiptasia diaphana TaxID=2652724 RepID=A0A913XNE1_EXADI|nr:protein boule-like [Exaiptasia diaphana]KXJ20227.1 Protein boule-like [Exaiptasia diaphana]
MADNDITKRIFVKGFNRETTESDLRAFFEEYGVVKESKIVRDKHGISKGYAFITFESQEDADSVREHEALDFKDKKLSIGKAIRRKSGRSYTSRHYHRQDMMHEGAMGANHQLFYTSGVDGNAVYYPVQQPQYLLVTTPPYSPQMAYQTQGMYSPQSHSTNPLFSPSTMMSGSYLQANTVASLPMQWNDYASLNRVRPIATHQETPSEIAVSSGQPTQIVGVAISDGNYVAESATKGEAVAQFVAIDPTKMKGDKPIPVRFLKHE